MLMRKQTVLFALCAVAGVAVIAFAEGKPGDSAPVNPELEHLGIQLRGEIAALQTKVAELQSKNQSLEGRVKGLETKVEEMSHPHMMPLNSQSSIWTQPLQRCRRFRFRRWRRRFRCLRLEQPRVWGEREINGWKFYVIPCEQQKQLVSQ